MTTGLKPYPTYKDSGEPSLGRIPGHWEVRSLASVISRRSDRGRPDLPLLSVVREKGVVLRSAMADDENHNVIPDDLSNYRVVRKGDLVINKMKAWQGSLGVAPVEGIVSPAYFVFRAAFQNLRFGHALLRSRPYVDLFARASDGVRIGQWDLSIDRAKRVPVPLPPEAEQNAIACFLEHSERHISRYIRAKQKLIALLNEQKQAIIHSAVTRGLDPNVRRKSSGSRWFSEVPAAWDVLPVRRLVHSAIDGPHFSPNYVDSGIPFLSARNLKVDGWSLADAKYISESDYEEFSRRVRPEVGDVLYTKGGTTGVARVVDLEFPFQVWVHIAVLKVKRAVVEPEFLALALNSPRCYEQAQLLTRGATNQDLGLGRMKSIEVPVPSSLEEQRAITAQLECHVRPLVNAVSEARRQLKLVREYRVRLIADVVSGRLDVRDRAAGLPSDATDAAAADGCEESSDGTLEDAAEEEA